MVPGAQLKETSVPISAATDRNSFAQDLFTPLPARYDRLAEMAFLRAER